MSAGINIPSADQIREIMREELAHALAPVAARLTKSPEVERTGLPELWTSKQVCAACKIGERELRRLVREGKFPHPVRLGARRIRWPRSVVERIASGEA